MNIRNKIQIRVHEALQKKIKLKIQKQKSHKKSQEKKQKSPNFKSKISTIAANRLDSQQIGTEN